MRQGGQEVVSLREQFCEAPQTSGYLHGLGEGSALNPMTSAHLGTRSTIQSAPTPSLFPAGRRQERIYNTSDGRVCKLLLEFKILLLNFASRKHGRNDTSVEQIQ